MNSEEQALELQKIIKGVINLPSGIQETVAKAFHLILDDDPVIKIAVDNLTKGQITKEQFLDEVESQYRLSKIYSLPNSLRQGE